MSIASQITRITNIRDASFTAVANKGVTVPSGSTLEDLPDLIALIETGGGSMEEVTVSDSGAVSQALAANTLYHFTGVLTSLTITLTSPESGKLARYHFDFSSGATATTLSLPQAVIMPADFVVGATTRYEIDILNNYGTVASWATS